MFCYKRIACLCSRWDASVRLLSLPANLRLSIVVHKYYSHCFVTISLRRRSCAIVWFLDTSVTVLLNLSVCLRTSSAHDERFPSRQNTLAGNHALGTTA